MRGETKEKKKRKCTFCDPGKKSCFCLGTASKPQTATGRETHEIDPKLPNARRTGERPNPNESCGTPCLT